MKMKNVNLPGKITLSSNSKRRYEILSKFFKIYKVIPYVEEIESLDFSRMVIENAKRKVIYALNRESTFPIVSADTIVVMNNEIFRKPKNEEEAFYILKKLSNNWHFVYSGFYFMLQNRKCFDGVSIARVKFKKLNDELIKKYIETKEPLDKAGAYAIQGHGKFFIEKFEGCYYTIVGFPVVKFIKKLKEAMVENS